MQDQILDILENLKGRTVVDIVAGDTEGVDSFSQFAVLRLDNNKQLTISSQTYEVEGQELKAVDEGLSGIAAAYGELDEFWDELEEKHKKD